MAQLILTDSEKAAALWSDCDDDTLGKLLRKSIAELQNAADQLGRTEDFTAALALCLNASERNSTAEEIEIEIEGQVGRWLVTVQRKPEKGE